MYYLRARYYNPQNGRFNRIDPFSGNYSDPQSLHKYLYCHANPINAIDPSGNFAGIITAALVITVLMFILFAPNVANAPGPGDQMIPDRGGDMIVDGFICLAMVPVFVYGRHLFRKIFRINRPVRLPQDVAVNPEPPKVKDLNRSIGKSPTQNARLQEDIKLLKAQGYTDFRVNQQQVNANNVHVGINQPDLQCTSPLPKQRLYMEYDTPISTRGPGHAKRILANDPEGTVILIKQK